MYLNAQCIVGEAGKTTCVSQSSGKLCPNADTYAIPCLRNQNFVGDRDGGEEILNRKKQPT